MNNQSKSKLSLVRKGVSYFAEITLKVELSNNSKHHIVELYSGREMEYWRNGIFNGIAYTILKLPEQQKLHISILNVKGISTDTFDIIMSYVTSRAMIQTLDIDESKEELELFEKFVFGSWDKSQPAISTDPFVKFHWPVKTVEEPTLIECSLCSAVISEINENEEWVPSMEELLVQGIPAIPNFGLFCSQYCGIMYSIKTGTRFDRDENGRISYY